MIAPSLDPGCKNKPEFGICNRPKKYYFSQDKICTKYSPSEASECRGNDNSFNTRRACLTTCGDCASKAVKGPCKANIQRYYFDKEKHICKKFTYGGCKGNGNNYKTKQECFALQRSLTKIEEPSTQTRQARSQSSQLTAINTTMSYMIMIPTISTKYQSRISPTTPSFKSST